MAGHMHALQMNLFDEDPGRGGAQWKFFERPSGGYFLHMYSQFSAPRRVPKALRALEPEPVGHTSYEYKHYRRFITIHSLHASAGELHRIAVQANKKPGFFGLPGLALGNEVDDLHNIAARTTLGGADLDAFIQFQRSDIASHCRGAAANDAGEGQGFLHVDEIRPELKIEKVPAAFRFRKKGKGYWHPICRSLVGYNTQSEGCVANMTPDGWYDPEGRCSYCYAGNQNAKAANSTVYDFSIDDLVGRFLGDADEFAEMKTVHIRLGQNSEICWPESFREMYSISYEDDNFYKTLKALSIANSILAKSGRRISASLSTKSLEYDEGFAELIRESDVSLMFSIDYESMEEGMLAHGFPPQARLKNGLEYAKAGCRVLYFVGTDMSRGKSSWQPDAAAAYEFFLEHKDLVSLQFLEMRIISKKVAEEIAGDSWESLKSSGRFGQAKNGSRALIPQRIHKDYLEIIREHGGKVSMCTAFSPGENAVCGGCGYR